MSPQYKIKNIPSEIYSNRYSTELQKISTATAKILKTATETPKELIKLIKIIKLQVLPRKCLSGRAVWVLREEREGEAEEDSSQQLKTRPRGEQGHPAVLSLRLFQTHTCDRSCITFPQDGNNQQPYFI